MSPRIKQLPLFFLLPLTLSLGGCLGTLISGSQDGAGNVSLRANTTTANCARSDTPDGFDVDCSSRYGTSPTPVESFFGVLFDQVVSEFEDITDPVVIQVPSGANGFTATYTNASGTVRPLDVTSGLTSLPIDANSSLVAERGMQLILLDLPADAPNGSYTFNLSYAGGGTTIKAVTVGTVKLSNGKTYHPPILPCVTSFAEVAPVAIPQGATPSLLSFAALGSPQGCSKGKIYREWGAAPTAGSVEVVEFYHSGLDHFFVSWVPDEIAKLDAGTVIKGWNRTGRTFRAFTSPQPGTSPVCRFYLPPAYGDSHFYGRGATECKDTATKFPNFILEDDKFMYLYLPTAGQCPANTTEVHRVFSNRTDANHRYSVDMQVIEQMAAKGWIPEGDGPDLVVMCAPN